MNIDPITRETPHYFPEYEIGSLRFIENTSDEAALEAKCFTLYDSIAPLFEKLNLWGVRVTNSDIRFVLEYSEGYAAELYYVYDGDSSSFSTMRIIEDELQLDDYWYAVETYELDVSP